MLILATASQAVLLAEQPTPTADEVVATMFARDSARESASGGYVGDREYVLENHKFQKRAQMEVRVTCERNGTKHFEVMSEDGWKSANKRVLRQMLATESDSSRPDTRPQNRITSDNYTFRMIETSVLDGRTAYVIEAIPNREDKSLFRGRIWVDAEDYRAGPRGRRAGKESIVLDAQGAFCPAIPQVRTVLVSGADLERNRCASLREH